MLETTAQDGAKVEPVDTDGGEGAGSPRGGPRWLKLVLLVMMVAAVIGGLAWWWREQTLYPATEDATIGANVLTVAPRVGGRVAEVLVVDHEHVAAGQILFRIEDDLLRTELAMAQAGLEQATQEVGALAAQVAAAQAQLNQAEATQREAEIEFARAQALVARGDVARAAFDQARARRDEAVAAREAAVAALRAAQQQAGATGADNATLRNANARLAQARITLEDSIVRSPDSGWVANVTLRPGAMVSVGQPVFSLVEDKAWWVDANFKETDIARIRPGQRATITVDMYPGVTLTGRVRSIGPGSGAVFSLLPPQNASGNWIKVTQRFPIRIAIDSPPDGVQLRVGASAVVRVDTTAAGR
jgi:membrane fusion protein (multidrug efflux system)